MIHRIIIAGAGGQGIMLLGKVLAEAAMNENRYVTWLPSYGAEVRGGTAHCMVTVSDGQIGSAYIDRADVMIIMNAPSMARMEHRLRDKGLLIVNSSLVEVDRIKVRALAYPFTDLARKLGNIRVANMAALGFFSAVSGIVKSQSVRKVILRIAPQAKKELIAINLRALDEGVRSGLRKDVR